MVVLGPAESGEDDQMRVKFVDGTVEDWEVEDFIMSKHLPKGLIKLAVSCMP